MLFELKSIVSKLKESHHKDEACVLASVVALEGSSYRQPGVRMLITASGEMVGALSGGCVEKEVIRQAMGVFQSGQPTLMTYDGRYKLGCEGILYILIEPFQPGPGFFEAWDGHLAARQPLALQSHFSRQVGPSADYGTRFTLGGESFRARPDFTLQATTEVFDQTLPPSTRLLIIGAEHDAHYMCKLAAFMGFDVEVATYTAHDIAPADFPEAQQIHRIEPDQVGTLKPDAHTAIILMTHHYAKDLAFTQHLLGMEFAYFGIIGSMKRKDKLFSDLIEQGTALDLEKLAAIDSPAGVDIGAITPQEIALSVMTGIVAKVRRET